MRYILDYAISSIETCQTVYKQTAGGVNSNEVHIR